VSFRRRVFAAAVLGLCIGQSLPAQEPAPLSVAPNANLPTAVQTSTNQRIADTIADNLRQSGQLRNFTVDIMYSNGTATLVGLVGDQQQREEVLRIVQGVPGVERVLDQMTIAVIQPVQAQFPPAPKPEDGAGEALPLTPAPSPATGPQLGEPVPLFSAPQPAPFEAAPPKMPPYAWPTYAPYNNYSRVAYPTAYPYNSFPFIGPVYPFPKVPLGWRSVKLEWEDGFWWFRKTATAHDWWHLRYW